MCGLCHYPTNGDVGVLYGVGFSPYPTNGADGFAYGVIWMSSVRAAVGVSCLLSGYVGRDSYGARTGARGGGSSHMYGEYSRRAARPWGGERPYGRRGSDLDIG